MLILIPCRYEPKYWYWEVTVIIKKMMLTGAMTIIAQGSSAQLVIALLIVMVNMLLTLKLGPFVDAADDYLSFLTGGQMYLTLLGGLLILMDNPGDPTYDATFMGTTMVIVNSFGFFALLLSLLLLHPKCRKRVNGEKGGRGATAGTTAGDDGSSNSNSTKVLPEPERIEAEELRRWSGD